MLFTALKDGEQIAEIWTKQPTIPAALVAKAVEVLALYAICDIRYFSFKAKDPGLSGIGASLFGPPKKLLSFCDSLT